MHPIELRLKKIVENLEADNANPVFVRNVLKEHLQDILLFVIYNDPKLKQLSFYGGSCLRKLYDLNRLSEDLDFETNDIIGLDEVSFIVRAWFKREKFDKVDISTQQSENINRVLVKFPVLYDLGLSVNENEKLHVKIEINMSPSGEYANVLTPYYKDNYSMVIKHYNIETLMAGKMVACLNRTYRKGDTGITIKGRDFYDLVWYMQKGVKPNAKRLKDTEEGYTVKMAFEELDKKVSEIKGRDLLIDLENLFSQDNFIEEWCENFHDLYKRYRKS